MTPPRRPPLSVTEAAATGNTMKLLVAMRERVAEAMTDERCHPRDLAALTRRLQDIAKDIEEIKQRMKRERPATSSRKTNDDSWNDNI